MLPSWEDGAWTNIMPSTSKVVSGLVQFQEPGRGVTLFSYALFPARQKTHTSNYIVLYVISQSETLIQIFLGYLVTARQWGCRSEGLQGFTLWVRQTLPRQFPRCARDGAVTEGSRGHSGGCRRGAPDSASWFSRVSLGRELLNCVSKGL